MRFFYWKPIIVLELSKRYNINLPTQIEMYENFQITYKKSFSWIECLSIFEPIV